MKLLTKLQFEQLTQNGIKNSATCGSIDFKPVVKFFTPYAAATWLLTEIIPDEDDLAFGLCDLGLGYPELGYVSLSEISSLTGRLKIERDKYFKAEYSIKIYADAARSCGHITEDRNALLNAYNANKKGGP